MGGTYSQGWIWLFVLAWGFSLANARELSTADSQEPLFPAVSELQQNLADLSRSALDHTARATRTVGEVMLTPKFIDSDPSPAEDNAIKASPESALGNAENLIDKLGGIGSPSDFILPKPDSDEVATPNPREAGRATFGDHDHDFEFPSQPGETTLTNLERVQSRTPLAQETHLTKSRRKALIESMRRVSGKQPEYSWQDYEELRSLFLADGDLVSELADDVPGFSARAKDIADTFTGRDFQPANLSRPLRQFIDTLDESAGFPDVKETTSTPATHPARSVHSDR